MQLYLQLPAVGVREAFPNEDVCRERLIDVRWPAGPECPMCRSDDVGFLETRRSYHCRACLTQFTVGSHTIFHRSRFSLVSWFTTAGDIIADAAFDADVYRLTVSDIQSRLATSHPAANRMAEIIRRDLMTADDSLMARCICTNERPAPPDGIEESGRSHYTWLNGQIIAHHGGAEAVHSIRSRPSSETA
ncbi:transposase [Limimaricola cinnabarinus]|uniref:transposase n=1 Tax=Limimaricola cinnabarinus TaxID=1125964 RepID=UPI0024927675|nr:transposase [Limimaricola cinnabarinus]